MSNQSKYTKIPTLKTSLKGDTKQDVISKFVEGMAWRCVRTKDDPYVHRSLEKEFNIIVKAFDECGKSAELKSTIRTVLETRYTKELGHRFIEHVWLRLKRNSPTTKHNPTRLFIDVDTCQFSAQSYNELIFGRGITHVDYRFYDQFSRDRTQKGMVHFLHRDLKQKVRANPTTHKPTGTHHGRPRTKYVHVRFHPRINMPIFNFSAPINEQNAQAISNQHLPPVIGTQKVWDCTQPNFEISSWCPRASMLLYQGMVAYAAEHVTDLRAIVIQHLTEAIMFKFKYVFHEREQARIHALRKEREAHEQVMRLKRMRDFINGRITPQSFSPLWVQRKARLPTTDIAALRLTHSNFPALGAC